jgi:predicted 3-demethylubiquinone-9 3-methyltransferase (glyoxalase superfamily)
MKSKNTICLWFDGDAVDAVQFYAKTFPDSDAFSFQVVTDATRLRPIACGTR